MMRRMLRGTLLALIRFFYRRVDVKGLELLPERGPVVVVANHPNGLLDPLLLSLALRRPLAFLAKSTLFSNPVARRLMAAFDAIPVYRPKDGQDTKKNDETFERARAHLGAGGWLALFPEGISHSEPTLQPLKTGAARIILGAEHAHDFGLGVRLLPVGLVYEEKHVFRSRVALSVGAPVSLADLRAAFLEDERAAVHQATGRIQEALSGVVLEAESSELWRGFLAVASWTSEPPTSDLAALTPRARALSKAYARVSAADPARAERVVEATRRFVRVLESVGIRDPLALEAPPPSAGDVVRAALPLLLLWPVAAIGALLGWAPYRAVRPLSVRLARGEDDLIGTLKLILGAVLITATYLVEGAVAAAIGGPSLGLCVLALAPLSGYVALRFGERLELRKAAFDAWWLRATEARRTEAIARERRTLAELVAAEVSDAREA